MSSVPTFAPGARKDLDARTAARPEAVPPATRGLEMEPAAPVAEDGGADPSGAAPLAADPMPGIAAGLAAEPSMDDMILAPGRQGRIPYQQAMRALGDGDLDGLEGLHFGRTASGRPMVDFEDENGEVMTMPVSDHVWMAALQRRTQSRAAREQMARQQVADNQIRSRIDEVMTVSRTPPQVAAIVASTAALNPERALGMLMRFEERRAMGKPVVQEFASLQLEAADEDRRARRALYAGDLSRMRATQMRAEATLLRSNASPKEHDAAASVSADAASFHALQFGPQVMKETGGEQGLSEYAMTRTRGWDRDGGPIQRAMNLAARADFGWQPIPKPARAEDVPAYLMEMNQWTSRYLGWPAFVATPQGANAVAMMLGRNDPQLEVSIQAGAALQQNMAGMQQNAMMMHQAMGGSQQPEQAAPPATGQRGGDVPPRSQQATIVGGLLRDQVVKVKDPSDPTDAEISSIAMALSRRGIKDPGELERAVIEYLDMAEKAGGSNGGRRSERPGGPSPANQGAAGAAPGAGSQGG